MDAEGHVDLSERLLKNMDVVIASIHTPCMAPGTREENTRAYLNAIKNPYINIIGHPDDGRYEVDYKALVEGAKEYGKVLELNNHSLEPDCFRKNARENDLCMLEYCKEYRVPVIMGSDAHFDTHIAAFDCAISVLEEADFPEELVLNRSIEAIRGHINKKLV
jgi:putative hydrolase